MSELINCPKCGNQVSTLLEVDAGIKAKLVASGEGETLPDKICSICLNEYAAQSSKGTKLRIEQQAKDKNRAMIWKGRVNLVKYARQMMTQKNYSDAAISYEKYIRLLEISYDLKPGGLTPAVFGNTARSKELTVIATTYWDLFRIYDTHPKYKDRMVATGQKLAEFLPYSPVSPDVLKKAQAFANTAKNPDVVRNFLRQSKAHTGKCFIATAAFDDAEHPVVLDFRHFRDSVLIQSSFGRSFIHFYYKLSPHIAAFVYQFKFLQILTRSALYVVHYLLRLFTRQA